MPQVQEAWAGSPQPDAHDELEQTALQTALEAGVHAAMYVVQVPQGRQEVDPATEAYDEPATHAEQAAGAVWPVRVLYVPTAQEVHAAVPVVTAL